MTGQKQTLILKFVQLFHKIRDVHYSVMEYFADRVIDFTCLTRHTFANLPTCLEHVLAKRRMF